MKHLLGLQAILPTSFGGVYVVLYFVGLLVTYYGVFSLLQSSLWRLGRFLLFSTTLMVLALLLQILTARFIDIFLHFFFIYYPLFIGGMLVGYYEDRFVPHLRRAALPLLIILLMMLPVHLIIIILVPLTERSHVALTTIATSLTMIPLYLLFILYGRMIQTVPKIFWSISYASFAVFLFHRPLWRMMDMLYPDDGSIFHWAYIALGGTVGIIILCYYTQRLYDNTRIRLSRGLVRNNRE